MKILQVILLAMLTSLGTGYVAHAQTADEVIDQYFENIGGKDAWRKIKSMKMSGEGAQMGMTFPMTITAKHPNKSIVVVDIQGKQLIEAFDGEVAWTINPFAGGTEPTIKTAEETKEAAKETFEDDLLDYADKGHSIALDGTEEVDGVETLKLILTKKEGDEVIYFFDPDNFVPIMTRVFPQAGPMKGQAIDSYQSDYEEVEGLIMPMSMEQKIGGQTMMSMTFKEVELDAEVDDTIFNFPKK